jgi:hypothetical protein
VHLDSLLSYGEITPVYIGQMQYQGVYEHDCRKDTLRSQLESTLIRMEKR